MRGNKGHHPAAVKLLFIEQWLYVHILAAEESTENMEEVKNEAAQRYLAALIFDGIRNVKFNALLGIIEQICCSQDL